MYRLFNICFDFWGFVGKLFAFVLMLLSPVRDYIHLVLILIFLDLITGTYASIKASEPFSARKLRHTVEKFVFYALAIISAYILQSIINDGVELPRIVALYIGATEVKSIYENISRITNRDIVSIAWIAIRDKIENALTEIKSKHNN